MIMTDYDNNYETTTWIALACASQRRRCDDDGGQYERPSQHVVLTGGGW